jgi:hypothetical protein
LGWWQNRKCAMCVDIKSFLKIVRGQKNRKLERCLFI